MNAIIAGKPCKKCGKKYYLSLGHPKWFDDVMKRHLPKSDEFLKFEKMAASGMCPKCYMEGHKESLPMMDVLVACIKK